MKPLWRLRLRRGMNEEEDEEEVGETCTPFDKRKKSKKETKQDKTHETHSEEGPGVSPLCSLVSSLEWAIEVLEHQGSRDGGFS